jgi:hypothetical protein
MLAGIPMRTRSALLSVCACLFAVAPACGGSAPAPVAPALARSAAPPAPPPPPDVSAVAEPKGVVVYGRLSKPSASFSIVHAWTNLPIPEAEQVTELVANAPFGPLLDLDGPIDLAIALPGARMSQVVAAVAAPVKDPDMSRAVLAERYKLVPGDGGVTLIQKAGDSPSRDTTDDDDDKDGESDDERACELAPAYGAAPVRLVCGSDARALSVLGPWLARTAPRSSFPADLHLEVRLQPVRPLIDQQRRMLGPVLTSILGGSSGDPGAREALTSTAGDLADFVGDLDGVSVELTLGDSGATANTTLRLLGTSSAFSRMVAGHPERNGPAPAVFWQLPGDADFATFSRGVEDADVARMRDVWIKVMGAGLGDLGLKDADRKAVLDALAGIVASWPVAYASGLDDAARNKARTADKGRTPHGDPADPLEARRVAAEALLGWRLLALDQAPAKTVAALKQLAAVWSRPSVAAAWRAKDKDSAPPSFRSLPLPKGAALPAGSAHYVVEVALPLEPSPRAPHTRPKPAANVQKAGAAKPFVLHVVVAPDGASRTWVAIAGDETLAASKLAATLAQGEGKLSSRAELASFKAGPVGSGGFFTVRGVYELFALGLVLSGGAPAATPGLDAVAQTPGQGSLAIPFSMTTQAGGPPIAVQTTLQVPRGAIDDVVAALLKMGASF